MNKKFELILNLSLSHTKILKYLDKHLSLHGISFSEYLMMYQLSLAKNKSMRRIDLAENMGMSASGVTRLLNPMEKLKIVEKEQNPRDARVSLVKLSDIGLELFNNATSTLIEVVDLLFESFEKKDIDIFFNLIKTLNKGV